MLHSHKISPREVCKNVGCSGHSISSLLLLISVAISWPVRDNIRKTERAPGGGLEPKLDFNPSSRLACFMKERDLCIESHLVHPEGGTGSQKELVPFLNPTLYLRTVQNPDQITEGDVRLVFSTFAVAKYTACCGRAILVRVEEH